MSAPTGVPRNYPNRRRLKIYAHAELRELKDNTYLLCRLASPGYKAKGRGPARSCPGLNCPHHITPRFTEPEWRKRSSRSASAS